MARRETLHKVGDEIVLPLLAEEVTVDRMQVSTGRVRVSTVTREREQIVDEFLSREEVEIERKPVGKVVERIPAVRRTRDTVIVPVVEEVITISRQLIVREEVHIRLVDRKRRFRQPITVRRQEAVISRLPVAMRGPSGDSSPATNQPTSRDQQDKQEENRWLSKK